LNPFLEASGAPATLKLVQKRTAGTKILEQNLRGGSGTEIFIKKSEQFRSQHL